MHFSKVSQVFGFLGGARFLGAGSVVAEKPAVETRSAARQQVQLANR
jgi:hypothetical protein